MCCVSILVLSAAVDDCVGCMCCWCGVTKGVVVVGYYGCAVYLVVVVMNVVVCSVALCCVVMWWRVVLCFVLCVCCAVLF